MIPTLLLLLAGVNPIMAGACRCCLAPSLDRCCTLHDQEPLKEARSRATSPLAIVPPTQRTLWDLRCLFPSGIHRFADQKRRVRSRPRPEFLYAPAIHLGDVEVAFLIDAESVHAPEASREIAPHAPGIKEVPFQIVFQ